MCIHIYIYIYIYICHNIIHLCIRVVCQEAVPEPEEAADHDDGGLDPSPVLLGESTLVARNIVT